MITSWKNLKKKKKNVKPVEKDMGLFFMPLKKLKL
jgi:hypothetical protein